MTTLNDILDGADSETVRTIQKEILAKGYRLDDPAIIPYGATRRVQLETMAAMPASASEAAEMAAVMFYDRVTATVTATVPSILKDLASKAAMTPLQERTRQITMALMIVWAIWFAVAGWIAHLGWVHASPLPKPVAEFVANGNSLELLQCQKGKFNTTPQISVAKNSGRHECNMAFWVEPESLPSQNGILAANFGSWLPEWLQLLLLLLLIALVGYAIYICGSSMLNDLEIGWRAISLLACLFFIGVFMYFTNLLINGMLIW